MKDDKYCKGCKYYFKPLKNVKCNNKDKCKRIAMSMIDEQKDLFELDDSMEDDLK